MTDDLTTAAMLLSVLGVIAAAIIITRRIKDTSEAIDLMAQGATRCACGRTWYGAGRAKAGVWHDQFLCQPERERIA